MAESTRARSSIEVKLLAFSNELFKSDLRYARVPVCAWTANHQRELAEAGFVHASSDKPRHWKLDVTRREAHRGISLLSRASYRGQRVVFIGLQSHCGYRESFLREVEAARSRGDVVARVAADGAVGDLARFTAFAAGYGRPQEGGRPAPAAAAAAAAPAAAGGAGDATAAAKKKSGKKRGKRGKQARFVKKQKRKTAKAAQAEATASLQEELHFRQSLDGEREAELKKVADRAAGRATAAARKEAQKQVQDRRHYEEMQRRRHRLAGNRLGAKLKRKVTSQVTARLEAEARGRAKGQGADEAARRRAWRKAEARSRRRRSPTEAVRGAQQPNKGGGRKGRGGHGGQPGRAGQPGRR